MRNLWKTYINVLNVCLTHQNLLSVLKTYAERTERVYNLRVAYMCICQRSGLSYITWIQMSTPSLRKSTTDMEDSERLRREYQIAIIQYQNHMIDWALFLANRIKRTRGQRRRAIWVRPWIGRRQEFGIYDQLMMELRNGDPASFTSFLRLPPDMFDELLDRVAQRITKMHGTGSPSSSI